MTRYMFKGRLYTYQEESQVLLRHDAGSRPAWYEINRTNELYRKITDMIHEKKLRPLKKRFTIPDLEERTDLYNDD